MSQIPYKRTEIIVRIQEECIKKEVKIPGLKTKKHSELIEIAIKLGINPFHDDKPKAKDETTEYFKDLTKREPFLGMYKKDYAQNRERNRLVLQDAKGERIDKNTFNHHGIIITYNLLIESAEEEDFSTIIQHFKIKVKNGEVTFKG